MLLLFATAHISPASVHLSHQPCNGANLLMKDVVTWRNIKEKKKTNKTKIFSAYWRLILYLSLIIIQVKGYLQKRRIDARYEKSYGCSCSSSYIYSILVSMTFLYNLLFQENWYVGNDLVQIHLGFRKYFSTFLEIWELSLIPKPLRDEALC